MNRRGYVIVIEDASTKKLWYYTFPQDNKLTLVADLSLAYAFPSEAYAKNVLACDDRLKGGTVQNLSNPSVG